MTAPRVAYICSSGRSGSTLLNLMLGSHPDFVCLGEIEHLPKNIALDTVCTCGARVSACPFWNRVFDRLASDSGMDMRAEPYRHALGYLKASSVVDPRYQTKAYLVRRRFVLGLKYLQYRFDLDLLTPWIRNEYDRRIDNTFELFDAVSAVAGRPFLADSSKQYSRAVSLYRRHPERVRVIVLVRDGRAVFNAMLRSGRDLPAALRFWQTYFERALPMLEKNIPRKDRLVIHYESLVQQPEETCRSLCRFLGVDFYSSMIEFSGNEKHILNGNEMRLKGEHTLKLDQRWMDQLSTTELRYFESNGGSRLNALLGYGPTVGSASDGN